MSDTVDGSYTQRQPIYCECGPSVGRVFEHVDDVGRSWFFAVPKRYHPPAGYDATEAGWKSNGDIDGQPFVKATNLSINTLAQRIELDQWADEAPQFYGARCKQKSGVRSERRNGQKVQITTVGLWLIGDDLATGAKAIRAVHVEPRRAAAWTQASLTFFEQLLQRHATSGELTDELRREADPERRLALKRAIAKQARRDHERELERAVFDARFDRTEGGAARYAAAQSALEEHRRQHRAKPMMETATTSWPPISFPPTYDGHLAMTSRGDTHRVVALDPIIDPITGAATHRRIASQRPTT